MNNKLNAKKKGYSYSESFSLRHKVLIVNHLRESFNFIAHLRASSRQFPHRKGREKILSDPKSEPNRQNSLFANPALPFRSPE
jgi:hypothetical protein